MAAAGGRRGENPDEAKVKEIRDAFQEDFEHWDPIYRDGDLNMKFITGDPWDTADRREREANGRPVLTFDELGQYLNHAQNEVRQNPRAPKFSPEGDGATDDTARVYANGLRKAEYRSNAQEAYTTCYDNALSRGFGFVRLKLAFEHERSFYQHVLIEPVANPNAVYPYCYSTRTDGSDWKRLTFVEKYTKAEFRAAFKEAEFTTFTTDQIAAVGNNWMTENSCQVAEFWEVETEEKVLREFEVPATKLQPVRYVTVLEGERKPRGGKLIQERVTEVNKVFSYLTNGVELLKKAGKKKHEHPGTMIPFAPCYGKMVWINKGSGPTRWILAMTTLAREPYAAYCFAASCEYEAIGTITKNPYWAYEGQLDANLKNRVKQSLHEPVAILEAKATLPHLVQQGTPILLPLPVRNPMAIDLSAYALAKEGARRAIQAAMGWTPLPTQAQRRNEKSGVALKQIEDSGMKGSYHFTDHYNDMIRRVGVLFEDVFDKITDTEREITTIEADKATKRVMVGGWNGKGKPPARPEGLDKAIDYVPSLRGRHALTVDVGPEFESERDEARATLDTIIGSPHFAQIEPPKRDKFLAIAIRERISGPMGQKMADVLDPQRKEGELPPAEELMGALQQAKTQIIPMLEQQIGELTKKLEAKVIEGENRLAVEAQKAKTQTELKTMDVEQKRDDSKRDSETALAIAELRAEIERLKLEQQRNLALYQAAGTSAEGAEEREAQAAESEAERQAKAAEGDKGRAAAASEGRENRAAAERQAARQAAQKASDKK